MGEGFGRWRLGDDEAALGFVTSVNIACGFHAGDPLTMLATARAAARHGVAIGAHPGLPNLLGFGRRTMSLSPTEVNAYVVTQVGALQGAARAVGAEVTHVKLHGAFTMNVEGSEEHAEAAAEAIFALVESPRVLWRSSPVPDPFAAAVRRRGGTVISELYPDLSYTAEGYVAPPRAGTFTSAEDALAQVRRAFEDGEVRTTAGTTIPLEFDSICVHSDSPEAIDFLRRLRGLLDELGCEVRAQGRAG